MLRKRSAAGCSCSDNSALRADDSVFAACRCWCRADRSQRGADSRVIRSEDSTESSEASDGQQLIERRSNSGCLASLLFVPQHAQQAIASLNLQPSRAT